MEQDKFDPYSLDRSLPNLVRLITSATSTDAPILVKFGRKLLANLAVLAACSNNQSAHSATIIDHIYYTTGGKVILGIV